MNDQFEQLTEAELTEMESEPPESVIDDNDPFGVVQAQHNLAQVLQKMPMNVESRAVSAFVNGVLNKCQIDSLVKVMILPPRDPTLNRKQRYQKYLVEALDATTMNMNEMLKRAPRILLDS